MIKLVYFSKTKTTKQAKPKPYRSKYTGLKKEHRASIRQGQSIGMGQYWSLLLQQSIFPQEANHNRLSLWKKNALQSASGQ